MKLFSVLSRFLFLILSAAALTALAAAQAPNQTPAVFSLVATPDFDGNDGSEEKPFRGSAIELFLDIQDDTPNFYNWGGYQAFRVDGTGTFCPGQSPLLFQFFSTENRLFGLKHRRVQSGTIVVRVTGFVEEAGFDMGTVEADFYITQHPNGCTGTGDDGGGGNLVINSFSANNGTNSAPTGSTIRLSARATDNDSSLTFLFYRSSTSAQKGSLIGNRTGTGCTSGCTAIFEIPAPIFPTTQFFTVDVQDSSGNLVSSSTAVTIVAQGGGGPDPQQCVPDQPASESCGATNVSVDAGCADPVLGGEPVQLSGSVSGAIGGSVVPGDLEWAVINSGGVDPSLLVFQNPNAAETTLSTPDVSTDQIITVRLRGTVGGCVAEDTLQITLLADPPPSADISVSLSDSPDPVSVGAEVTYSMTVANNGPNAAPDVQAQFNLTGAGTILSATPAQCTAAGSTVTCNFGTLTNGQSIVATIQVRADAGGTLTGSASAASGADETNGANNSATATTTVAVATTDVSIDKSGPQGQQPLGAEIEYRLAVVNNGPEEAVNVQVTDVLPAQVAPVAVQPVVTTEGSCTLNGQVVSCSLGDMPVQAQALVTIRVTTETPGIFNNTASVSSSTADGNSANNSSTVSTEVTDAEANLSIVASAEVPDMGGQGGAGQALPGGLRGQGAANGVVRVMQGEAVSYLIEVTNNGPDDATNVVVTDALPEGMEIVAAVADQGDCEIVAGTVSCALGRVDQGASALIRIEVVANAESQVINAVTVQASQIDPDPDDNQAEAEVRIRTLPGLFATVHADGLSSLSSKVPGLFVGLALHNPIGDENPLNIQALSEDGEVVADFDQVDDPVQPLGQTAVLSRQLVGAGLDADTILAEGLTGPVQGFFMIGGGAGQLLLLDGIGNRLEDSPCDPVSNICLLYLPQARQVGSDCTAVFIFNPSLGETAAVTLTLFDVDGGELGASPLELAPSGSVIATLDQLFGEGLELEDGFLRIESDTPVRGFEAVVDQDSLITIPAMRGFLTDTLSVPHFAIGSAQLSSPIRILNVGPNLATVDVRATFDDPSRGTVENFFTVDPNTVQTVDMATLLEVDVASLPPNRVLGGFMELFLDGGNVAGFPVEADVVPIITFNDGLRKTRSSLPMVEGEGEPETLFLQVAQTRNLQPFHGLAIFNPRQEAVQVTVQAFNEDGDLTAENVVPIAPRSRVVGLLNSGNFFEALFEQTGGYLRVSSDSPVIAFSLFGGNDYLSAIGGQTPLK